MKIDAHQHFWKYDPRDYGWISDDMFRIKRDFLPKDLGPLLQTVGFDGSVAVQARQSIDETRFLLQHAKENDFIKGVVGWIDLRNENVENQLKEFIVYPKFKGVRHVIQDEPDDRFILQDDFKRGISILKNYNLTYDILVFPKQLPYVLEFLNHFPDQPFVIDHLAKPGIASGKKEPWAAHMQEIAKHKNVYCKISGMVTEAAWNQWTPSDFQFYLDTVFDAFGEDRLMIGSDWPVCLLAAKDYKEVLAIAATYFSTMEKEIQNKVYGKNAVLFYQL